MTDLRYISRASLASLVKSFGCFDGVAEIINARWGMVTGQGGASKGTISKKMSGALDWTLPDVIALEDAAGRFPVTRLLMKRMMDESVCEAQSLVAHGASIAKEGGEAVAAILAAQQSHDANDLAQAAVEVRQAIDVLLAAESQLNSQRRRGDV